MKLFLAAAEASDSFANVVAGEMKRTFASYFQIVKAGPTAAMHTRVRYLLENTECIVDSGAHSFFTAPGSTSSSATGLTRKTAMPYSPQEYFDRYLEWLTENRDRLGYFVELDVSDLVGYPLVLEWRNRIVDAGLGNLVISVYHPNSMTWQDYIDLLDSSTSGYIGLQGIRRGSRSMLYNKAIREAYDRGVRVHGFAMTKQKEMKMYPFYSVDSASWKSGVMWGSVAFETSNGITFVRRSLKAKNKMLEAVMKNPEGSEHYGIKVDTKSAQCVNRPSIAAYIELERKLTVLWEARGIHWEDQVAKRQSRLALSL